MATITVNGNTIDPESPEFVSEDAKNSNFIYIQGDHDLTVDEKLQLKKLDVEVEEYVAEYTYLCRYVFEDLEKIRALTFVRAANVYNPVLKSTISLKTMVEGEVDRTEYEVDLILHNNPNVNSAALAPYVAQAAGVDVNELEIVPDKIRLTVQQDKLDDLASLDSVNRIEEVRPKQTTNDQARVILQAETLFTSTGYQGAGQTICVADTGFDQGSAEDSLSSKVHPAFTGRVQLLQSFWTEKDFKDPVGHGTHVCGSACANGVYLDSAEGKSVYIKGTAPAANLMVQSISRYSKVSKSWTVKTPLDLFLLFSGPYKEGVRIHNDSWNNRWDEKTGQFGYESDATMVDKFVHEHQDFIVLISAGNDALEENAGTSQIGGNGAAKNCITVGATGTTRRNNGQRFDPSGPVYSRAEDTATFSSRGPTKSTVDSQGQSIPGRIKPDVIAPGVAILSAASRSLDANAWIRKRYGFSNDNDWLYMSGTSQATPLVSGCVALLREALEEYGKRHPSAALVKALLINGAVNHSCQNEFGFDGLQGFGRIDVDRSITMIKQSTFVEGGSRFETTQHDVSALRLTPTTESWWESSAIEIPNGRNRLVATLAYPDEPGALLQNDINLVVKVGEVERHGNMGSEVGFDHTNNVERVIWNDIASTTATIRVQAHAFTKLDSVQSFAVVWNVQPIHN